MYWQKYTLKTIAVTSSLALLVRKPAITLQSCLIIIFCLYAKHIFTTGNKGDVNNFCTGKKLEF